MFDLSLSDGKEAKKVIKQAADDVDQVKRLSSNFIVLTMEPYMSYTSLQKTNCGRTSTNGSPHRIHQLTITLRVIPITRRRQPGSFEAAFSGNGNQQLRCFGFMENVSTLPLLTLYRLMRSLNVAGSGKSILWLVDVYLYPSYVTKFLSVLRSSKILKPCARPETHRWRIFILTFGTPTSRACTI